MAYPILDIDLLLDALRHQKLEDALAAFDEFIANPVRGPRDIFYTPEHGLVVVDHEGAMEAATQPHQAVTNWLAERVLERLPPLQLPVFLKRLRAKVSVLHSSRFGAAPSAVQFEQSGVELYNGLVDFLQQRLSHLDRLLSERVFPGQAYLAPSDRDAPDRAADV